jgi:hypothetical protein
MITKLGRVSFIRCPVEGSVVRRFFVVCIEVMNWLDEAF